jgi:hypothetical protein
MAAAALAADRAATTVELGTKSSTPNNCVPPVIPLERDGSHQAKSLRSSDPRFQVVSPSIPLLSPLETASNRQKRSNIPIVLLFGVLAVGAIGLLRFAAKKPGENDHKANGIRSEYQHYTNELGRLVNSDAEVHKMRELQDSHYEKLTGIAMSEFKGDADRVYQALKAVTDEATAVRQEWQDGIKKLSDAGSVDPVTLTTLAAMQARKELAMASLQSSLAAQRFYNVYIEKMDSNLTAIGVDKATRDKLLAANRTKQSRVLELINAHYAISKNSLAVIEFLKQNFGHWNSANGQCVFETQKAADEYNALVTKLQDSLETTGELERSFINQN